MLSVLLAHSASGLAGDGVPSSLLYGLIVAGSAIGALGLRATDRAPAVEAEAVGPDGADADPWPTDGAGPVVRIGTAAIGAVAVAVTLAVGWLGSPTIGLNPVPILMGSAFWWGGLALSWLLGDWWRLFHPFALVGARSRPDAPPPTTNGRRADWWLPAVLLASFAWVLSCWHDGARPRSLAGWLALFTAVMVAGAVARGPSWLRRNEPFAVLFGAIAAAGPVRWDRGRPRLGSPLAHLAARGGGRRTAAVLIVAIGSTVWEATAGTQWFADIAGTNGTWRITAWSTFGLVWCIALVATAWWTTGTLAEALATRRDAAVPAPVAGDLAPSLAALAVATAVGHQLLPLLLDLQNLIALVSDPLARGWDLFATVDHVVDDDLVGPGAQAWIQLGLLATALGLLLSSGWARLADRVGAVAVGEAGWAVALFTAVSGVVALKLLLGA